MVRGDTLSTPSINTSLFRVSASHLSFSWFVSARHSVNHSSHAHISSYLIILSHGSWRHETTNHPHGSCPHEPFLNHSLSHSLNTPISTGLIMIFSTKQ